MDSKLASPNRSHEREFSIGNKLLSSSCALVKRVNVLKILFHECYDAIHFVESCNLHSRNVPQHFLRSIRFTHLLTHKSLRDFLFTQMIEQDNTPTPRRAKRDQVWSAIGIFWQFTFFWGTPHWVRDQVVSWQSSEKLVHFLEFRKITLVNWDISLFDTYALFWHH